NVLPVTIPPLRERREDIPLLVRHFVRRLSARLHKPVERIPKGVMDALTDYDWPGNVRELQNVLERAVVLSQGPELVLEGFGAAPGARPVAAEPLTLEAVQRRHIQRVLE